ncbi:MAG: pyrimidine/purine nucleoside phosphorylase [Pontiellaceae bacterium]|jgi:hypothetical protein|nr:pyrimidine/purine nucleoside phosphorylase [Pontiellaceae bacterium]
MTEFRNVNIVKKANIYFHGNVTSRTVLFSDGTKKTLGIMLPGEYEFSAKESELMDLLGGQLDVLLPGEKKWKTVEEGESFLVPAHSKFKVKVRAVTDYCCSYIQ